MTSTTTVLFMAAKATVPSRILRRFGLSANSCTLHLPVAFRLRLRLPVLSRLEGLDLPLAQQRENAGDLAAEVAQAGHVRELAGDVLEAQVEELGFGLGQPVLQLHVVEGAQLGRVL